MRQENSRELSSIWRTDTDKTPHTIDVNRPDARGLKRERLVGGGEIVARTARIENVETERINTEERAAQLSKLAADVVRRAFGVEGENLSEIKLVISELVSNAFRYSVGGAVWVSIVQTLLETKNDELLCVLDITVANEIEPKAYKHDDQFGDRSLSVHGRGGMIIDALALRAGDFEVERDRERREKLFAAYAIMRCLADHDNGG